MTKVLLSAILVLFASMAVSAQNCSINAGANSTLCLGQSIQLDGSVGGPINSTTLQWSLVSQPAGANAVITSPGSLLTNVSGASVSGAYTFRLQVVCGDAISTQDEVTVTLNPVPNLPTLTGTSNFPCYAGDPVNLTGSAPGSGETVSWSIVSGANGTFGSPGSNTTTFTPVFPIEECGGATTVVIRYRVVSASGCERATTRSYTFSRNYGLWATANPQQVCGSSTVLKGSCPGAGTVSWSQISGPNTATIVNSTSRTTAATGLVEGSYVFRYTATGGCSPGTVDVNVTVAGSSAVTAANAGINQYFCQIPGTISLTGNKQAVGETTTWSQLSGGTTVTFGAPGEFNSTASGLADSGAPYTFLYKISNGICFTTDSITVYKRPDLQLTSTDVDICTTIGTGLTSPAPVQTSVYGYRQLDTVKVDVTMLSGPPGATANTIIRKAVVPGTATPVISKFITTGQTASSTLFGDSLHIYSLTPSSESYYLDFPFRIGGDVGVYKFRIRVTTDCGTVEKDITLTRGLLGSGINAGTDVALPCNATSATLAGNLTNNLGLWSTVKMPVGATNPINSGNQALRNPPIATLIPGTYVFRYTNNMGPTCAANQFDEVKVVIANTAPATPAAGADLTTCAGSYQLNGSLIPADAFGSWSVISPTSSGVTFSDPTVASPVASNLQPNTTYTFRYTLTNGCGNSFDEVTITTNAFTSPPKPVISSTQLNNCGTISQALPANVSIFVTHPTLPAGTTATWVVVTQPAGITFTSSPTNGTTTQVTLQNVTQSTVFSIIYTLNNTDCPSVSVSDTLTGYIRKSTESTPFSAGSSQQLCSVTSYPLTANLNGSLSTGPVLWSQLYSSNGAQATIATPGSPSTTVTIPSDGMYRFKYEIQSPTDASCQGKIGEDVTQITTSSPGQTALAGVDIDFCDASGVTSLTATPVTTGRWEIYQVLAGGVPAIANITSPTSNLTFNGSGEVLLRWSSYGSIQECGPSSSDLVKVRYTAPANAGADQTLCDVTSVNLAAAAPTPAIGTWTQINGPTASILDPGNPGTLVSGLVDGTYTFRFSVAGGPTCSSTDDVTFIISSNSDVASAGSDMASCSGGANNIRLNATAAPAGNTGTWSIVSTPSGVTPGSFSDVHDPGAIYTGVTQPGKYVFAWTLGNGPCTSTDYIEVTAGSTPCPLPVTLVRFSGKEAEGVTTLHWVTTAETNFSHFEIEYASKDLNFKTVGRVTSRGEAGNYNFTYRQPDVTGYYRLRIVDMDTSYENSQIITVRLNDPEIILFSNPAGDKVRVRGLNGAEVLRVFDSAGRQVLYQKNSLPEAEIMLYNIPSGNYILEIIKSDGQVLRKTFVKVN